MLAKPLFYLGLCVGLCSFIVYKRCFSELNIISIVIVTNYMLLVILVIILFYEKCYEHFLFMVLLTNALRALVKDFKIEIIDNFYEKKIVF